MMEAEMVSETLGFNPQLTRLVAREYFIIGKFGMGFLSGAFENMFFSPSQLALYSCPFDIHPCYLNVNA
jgi:hypothetical protein